MSRRRAWGSTWVAVARIAMLVTLFPMAASAASTLTFVPVADAQVNSGNATANWITIAVATSGCVRMLLNPRPEASMGVLVLRPFAPPPLQRLQHYYELLRPLVAHRYCRPCLLSLYLSLPIATEGSRSST